MKTLPLLICLFLPACSLTPTAVDNAANVATVGTSLLPPTFAAKIKALVAAHPQARPYLVTVANSLESIADAEKRLPPPDSTFNTLLSWGEFIPEIGQYIGDFDKLYRLYYPTIAPTAAALTEIAELVRSSAT